jgi:hypothetical protein
MYTPEFIAFLHQHYSRRLAETKAGCFKQWQFLNQTYGGLLKSFAL